MNPINHGTAKEPPSFNPSNLLIASGGGVCRGAVTSFITHPIDLIRVRLQAAETKPETLKIVRDVFAKQGVPGFYEGFADSLKVMTVKQVWRWPIIMGLPFYFEKHNVKPVASEFATGILLATLDAFGTAPLSRARLRLLTGQEKTNESFFQILRHGWKGSFSSWSTLTVNWCTALSAQRFYRDQYKAFVERDLSTLELLSIGMGVGVTVSLVAAPFEYVTVHSQGLDKPVKSVLPEITSKNLWKAVKQTRSLYRGFNLLTVSRLVHNITTVVMIEYLSPIFSGSKT